MLSLGTMHCGKQKGRRGERKYCALLSWSCGTGQVGHFPFSFFFFFWGGGFHASGKKTVT